MRQRRVTGSWYGPGCTRRPWLWAKPMEILGDGPVSKIEIRARDTHVLLFQAPTGRVQDLTLRQTGGLDCHGVEIRQGQLQAGRLRHQQRERCVRRNPGRR